MNLYLIRHAEAENPSLKISDFERQLTKVGIEKFSKAVLSWKYFIEGFNFIITSPYIRALQTAEIVSKHFPVKDGIIKDSRLGCGSITEDVIDIINTYKGTNIALVGHEPDFSEHVSNLISNSGAFVDFKKGMIAKINFNGRVRSSAGVLEYLIPVKAFRQ